MHARTKKEIKMAISLHREDVSVVPCACRIEHEKTLEQFAALVCLGAVVEQHAQTHLGQQRHCKEGMKEMVVMHGQRQKVWQKRGRK